MNKKEFEKLKDFDILYPQKIRKGSLKADTYVFLSNLYQCCEYDGTSILTDYVVVYPAYSEREAMEFIEIFKYRMERKSKKRALQFYRKECEWIDYKFLSTKDSK